MMAVWNGLSDLSFWLKTGDHGNMVFAVLALALLAELSIRVVRRFLADRRAKINATHNNLRVSTRLRRAPSA
jgi:hypothetical protein